MHFAAHKYELSFIKGEEKDEGPFKLETKTKIGNVAVKKEQIKIKEFDRE